jgi:signal transduction histidine kinase
VQGRARAVLIVLLATAVVVTVVFCAAGWMLVAQQREIDRRSRDEALEDRAETLAVTIRGRLADAGDRLGAWLSDRAAGPAPLDGAVVVSIDSAGARVTPSGSLPFVPLAPADEIPHVFEAVEDVEFRLGDLQTASNSYRALARDPDARVRAGALLRLGRVLRRTGDLTAALAAYERLERMGDVRAGSYPAAMAAILGRREVFLARKDADGARAAGALLQRGLDEGRWVVTRAQAERYREAATVARPANWSLAAATSDVWTTADGRLPPRGQQTVVVDGRAIVVIWRASAERTLLAGAFLDQFFADVRSDGARWRLVDGPTGRRLAGDDGTSTSASITRTVSAEYPWTLEVSSEGPADAPGSGTRLLPALLAVTLLFVWGTTYFMARAIRREAAVARLQTDFVAAVSHEFRSPLTTVRQLAEMLDSDRLRSDDRRRLYYRVIAGEAARLQRLIETLLDFGRLEAGVERYQLAPVEASTLVRCVVQHLADQARAAGVRVDLAGPDEGAVLLADEAALGVALRNLIDNAIKYSPGAPAVRVEWERDGDLVAIRVIDVGLGIPRSEHAAVFRKFVRGHAAAQANVRGTGVGLAMVQRIVLAHGGDIRLDSEVGRGSTFTMRLPMASPAPDEARLTA